MCFGKKTKVMYEDYVIHPLSECLEKEPTDWGVGIQGKWDTFNISSNSSAGVLPPLSIARCGCPPQWIVFTKVKWWRWCLRNYAKTAHALCCKRHLRRYAWKEIAMQKAANANVLSSNNVMPPCVIVFVRGLVLRTRSNKEKQNHKFSR